MILAHDGDRRAARDRLAAERRRVAVCTQLEKLAPLTTFYRGRPGLRTLPPGPTWCPEECPWCDGRWAA
jgi:hypothetical protein